MDRFYQVRWFTKKPINSISSWFSTQGKNFDQGPHRTRLFLNTHSEYLALLFNYHFFEVYQKIPGYQKFLEHPQISGHWERWTTWRFPLKMDSKLIDSIFSTYGNHLIEVNTNSLFWTQGEENIEKENKLLQTLFDIEYSRIKVKESLWYTLCLRSETKTSQLKLFERLIDILNESELNDSYSMGYPEFIQMLFPDGPLEIA